MEGFWSTVSVTYDGLLEYDIINGLGKTTPTLKTYWMCCDWLKSTKKVGNGNKKANTVEVW